MKLSRERKYARLLVRRGVNIQKKQRLVIRASTEIAPFVEILVAEAYKAGARSVEVDWANQAVTKAHYRYCSVKELSDFTDWQLAKLKYRSEELPAFLSLISADPDGMKGMDMDKMRRVRANTYPIVKPFNDAMENRYQWCVAAVPGKKWAKKMFPNEKPAAAVRKLWECIFETCLVDKDNDPLEAWDQKNKAMAERCRLLNGYRFDYLEYKSANGTSFRCHLMPQSNWCAGGETTLQGAFFNPNMPTEEVFTTPMKGKCEGRLVASMPLSYQGNLIEDFYIDYEDGKAVFWDARVGKPVLDSILNSDEGSKMLGELALVPFDSPISNQHLLYYNTLFDENASCHVAIGRGYTSCVDGFENRTQEEMREMGVNESQVHVDFMIGTADLSITGYKDGKAIPIFRNGNWVL